MIDVRKKMTTKELRSFGVTTGSIVAVLFGLAFPWLLDRPSPRWPWILAAILIAWGLIAPKTLNFVYQGWMRFGLIMSKITTPIILGVVFYIVVLPTGIIRRLLGLDSMARKFERDASSYRVPSKNADKQDLKRPF